MSRHPIIVGLGEVLWDMLPAGRQLGGAPANFAYHASALGAEGRLVSRVGDDEDGREILARLTAQGLSTATVSLDAEHATGLVDVTLGADGQPQYTIREDAAWDFLAANEVALEAVAEAEAICFGSLAQRAPVSRAGVHRLLAAAPPQALRIFDVNLRLHYFSKEVLAQSLAVASVLKLNDAELPVLAGLFGFVQEPRAAILQFAQEFALSTVALTRGAEGSLLWREGEWAEDGGEPTTVVDTVGAGDSFTAALTLGLLRGERLEVINEQANRVARFVCGCHGATPVLPPELVRSFDLSPPLTS